MGPIGHEKLKYAMHSASSLAMCETSFSSPVCAGKNRLSTAVKASKFNAAAETTFQQSSIGLASGRCRWQFENRYSRHISGSFNAIVSKTGSTLNDERPLATFIAGHGDWSMDRRPISSLFCTPRYSLRVSLFDYKLDSRNFGCICPM